MKVKVSNLYFISRDYPVFQPTHTISILDPCIKDEYIPEFPKTKNLLRCFFYDIDKLQYQQEPIIKSVEKILNFLYEFIESSTHDKSILIHCHAGVSRSTATAYLLYCLVNENPETAFENLLKITNKPWPNRNMIKLADDILQRNGDLLIPLDNYTQANKNRYVAYQRLYSKRAIGQFNAPSKRVLV